MTGSLTATAPALVDRRDGTHRQWWVLAALLGINYAIAALGGLASTSGVDGWYAAAEKPPWTPPNWLFGPVWLVLYGLVAVAAWLVWRRLPWTGRSGAPSTATARPAIALYAGQLVLNALWTPIFFGAQLLWAGLAVIVALDVVLAATVVAFWRRSRAAGVLLLPYLAWVLYATTLNAGVAALN